MEGYLISLMSVFVICIRGLNRTMEGYLRAYIGAVPGQTLALSKCVKCNEGKVILTHY